MKNEFFIKNRNNKKISILIDKPKDNVKGIAFVMHGLGGRKEQAHMEVFSKSFVESGYISIRFDTRNTFGESEGSYEEANITSYYEDLQDVTMWAKKQEFYREPFFLIGHSLGGICICLYAEEYPQRVKGVAPISTVVSGKLNIENMPKEEIEEYNRTGWRINKSTTIPGLIKKLKWEQYKKDILKYDLLKKVEKLKMPVLLIVGDKDESTPLSHQKILYSKIPGKKELHIIEDAPHTFIDVKHLDEINVIIKNWIRTIE